MPWWDVVNRLLFIQILQAAESDCHSDLCEILQVSEVTVVFDPAAGKASSDALSEPTDHFSVRVSPVSSSRCPRCRKYCSSSESDLCYRCGNVIAARDPRMTSEVASWFSSKKWFPPSNTCSSLLVFYVSLRWRVSIWIGNHTMNLCFCLFVVLTFVGFETQQFCHVFLCFFCRPRFPRVV